MAESIFLWGKFFLYPKWGNWCIFGPGAYLMRGTEKQVKVMLFDFKENSYYVLSGGKWVIYGAKSKFLNFTVNLFTKFFRNCTRWQGLKWQFWICNENYDQNEAKGSFLGLKSTLNFPLNLFPRFFLNCTWWQVLMSDKNWLFWIFIKKSHSEIGVLEMGSIVISCLLQILFNIW